MEALSLELAPGWTEVKPRATPFALAYMCAGGLKCLTTDFRGSIQSGVPEMPNHRPELNCPIAVDHERGLIYWVGVESAANEEHGLGPCSLMEFDPKTRNSRIVYSLPAGRNFNWLLTFDRAGDQLISQIHTRNLREAHEIAQIEIRSGTMVTVKPDQECFYPIAAYPNRKEILFRLRKGGIAFVGLDGQIRARCPAGQDRGTSLRPTGDIVAIAEGGVFLWDLKTSSISQVANTGNMVEWSPDGKELWYQESDAELYRFDLSTKQETCVVRLLGGDALSTNYTQEVRWSPDGRFILALMSRKCSVSSEEKAKREAQFPNNRDHNSFDWDHYFCVVDTQAKEVWTKPGYTHNLSWISSDGIQFDVEKEKAGYGI